jgi:hypothetical protein
MISGIAFRACFPSTSLHKRSTDMRPCAKVYRAYGSVLSAKGSVAGHNRDGERPRGRLNRSATGLDFLGQSTLSPIWHFRTKCFQVRWRRRVTLQGRALK